MDHPVAGSSWTVYHDFKSKSQYMLTPASATAPDTIFNSIPTESTDYEAGLAVVGEFDTVEEFCRYFNWL